MADNSNGSGKLISRRSLLGGAVAGVGAGALGSVSSATNAFAAPAYVTGKVQEMVADVVVAGSGMGGMSAAVRAAHQGARVILLEKAPQVGGTASHSEGGVANSEYDDMRLNSPEGDPVVQRNVYDNVEKWYSFMEEIGAPLTRAIEGMRLGGQQQGGQRQGRTIAPIIWVRFMAGELERLGGTILTDTPITRLHANGNREIVGAEAEGPNGHIRIRTKAVILATGGWMHNREMVTAHITRHQVWQRNVSHDDRTTPLFTGDGFHLASELGAAPSRAGWDSFYGYLLPAHPGHPREPMANGSLYNAHYGVALNLYGYRFADESGGKWGTRGRDRFTRRGAQMIANEAAREVEASAISIWDERINREYACADCALGGADRYLEYQAAGSPVARADTIEELARQIEGWNRGTPAERIVQQVREYNQAAANGKAWALPVPKTGAEFGHVEPLQGGLYAVLGTAGMTATFGGLRVNSNGEVRDRNDRPIRGLFAAGIDIGGFSEYAYLGNLTLGASHGYLSGTNAAKQPEPSGGWTATFTTSSALR